MKKKKKTFYQLGQKGAPATLALAAPFVPVGVTNRDKKSSFVSVARPGTKPGQQGVSQPGQINVFVVVKVYKVPI